MSTNSYPVKTIAKLLGLTERRVQQLAREGVIPRAESGRYDLVAVVQAYIKYLRDRSLGEASTADVYTEKARLTKLTADKLEIEISRQTGQLVDAAAVKKEAFTAGRQVRDRLMKIPDKISPELATMDDGHAIRNRLLAEFREVLEGLASE
ncbi:MAG: terminase small subunit, Nu1 [Leptospirillia bacterium]